jgi:predicted amidohydrolase
MIKVAAVQMSAKKNKEENLERALKFLKLAVENKARLIAFPELFSTPWFPCEIREEYFKLAESLNGRTMSVMKKASKEHAVIIAVPFFERYRKGYYNSCAVVEAGKVVGVYRKTHIPSIPMWEEQYYFKPGKDLPVFDTSIGKIGVQICWDNFYWEGYRSLALSGAKLVITPTASAFNTQKRWKMVIATHAFLNNIFILRVNRFGKEKMQEFYGNSFLVGPDGVFIGQAAGMSEGIYLADVDMSEVAKVRKIFPFLKGRKPDLYGKVVSGRKHE